MTAITVTRSTVMDATTAGTCTVHVSSSSSSATNTATTTKKRNNLLYELPPLYFQEKQEQYGCSPLTTMPVPSTAVSPTDNDDATTTTTSNTSTSNTTTATLTPELLQLCCTQYGNYGTLAKLACVQRSWQSILYDAVVVTRTAAHDDDNDSDTSDSDTSSMNQSYSYTWCLANALLDGTHGLRSNPVRAMQLFQQMTGVPIHPTTHRPIFPDVVTTSTTTTTMTMNTITEDDENHPRSIHLPSQKQESSSSSSQAMKKLAYYYLEQSELLYDDDDVDRTVASSSSSTSSEITTTTPSGALLSLGLGWLQCAYHVGYDRDAAYELAVLYEYGHYHIPIDIVWAVHYFEIAACAGHVEAMVELALCYELGCGVTVNDEVALDWYLRAAAAGHTIAKYSVGEAYERARGVPLSKEEACLWYYKAALAGDRDSIVALQRLQDIARIVIPGITTTLLLLNDTSG